MNATATASDELPRFDSLAAMQDSHAQLLTEIGANVLGSGNPDRVLTFVRRGAATGSILDAKEDRAAAQGLINFWIARLESVLRAARHKGDESPEVALPEFDDTLLVDFNPATLQAAVDRADAWLASRSETDRNIARRVLLRLVRLPAGKLLFEPVPLVRASLHDLDEPEHVNDVVAALADAGVVRVRKAELPELDRIALRSPELITRWATYEGWLAQRRKFRDAVVAWDRAGRPAHALAAGEALEEARAYLDRDTLERAFIEQSRQRESREREWNRYLKWKYRYVAIPALILLGGLVLFLILTLVSMAHTNAALNKANTDLNQANTDLNTANTHLNTANAALDQTNADLRERERLTNLRIFARGFGELIAAHTRPEQEVAEARWRVLVDRFHDSPPLDQLPLNKILEGAVWADEPTWPKIPDFPNRIRRLRNSILENPRMAGTLSTIRAVTFKMVRLSAYNVVTRLEKGSPFSEVEPYVREFISLDWGEMLLVEGPKVQSAMHAFGRALKAVRKEAEKPGPVLTEQILRTTIPLGPLGKDVTKDLTDLRLNGETIRSLETKARKLGIDNEKKLLEWEESLNKFRFEVVSRPVSKSVDPKLVIALRKQLQPLLDALNDELELENPEPIR